VTRSLVQHVTVDAGGLKVVHYQQDGEHKTAAALEILRPRLNPNVAGLNLETARVEYHAITPHCRRRFDADVALSYFRCGEMSPDALRLCRMPFNKARSLRETPCAARMNESITRCRRRMLSLQTRRLRSLGKPRNELDATGVAYVAASAPFNDHGKAIAIGEGFW
jgi:hypothetical protein